MYIAPPDPRPSNIVLLGGRKGWREKVGERGKDDGGRERGWKRESDYGTAVHEYLHVQTHFLVSVVSAN